MQARANLTKARSELERARVQLTDAQQKYARAKELASQQLLPASELDAAKIAVDSAMAAVARSRPRSCRSQAAVTQSEASVNQSQVNRDHTIIVAPIDGIVTQRSVDVGQTVAASMQAPTLFVIAADLTEMQVNANIDEADVGRIRPGQQVSFRVDAYPTDNFVGTVTQIRLQPVVVSNVTTYGTVITVPNRELKLKPGMTANVKIEIAKRTQRAAYPECRAAVPSDRRSLRRAQPGAATGGPTRSPAAVRAAAAAAVSARRRARHGLSQRRRRSNSRGPSSSSGNDSGITWRRPPLATQSAEPRRRSPRIRLPAAHRRRRGPVVLVAASEGRGGRPRRSGIPGADARTLQDHVARRTAAVPRAHERARR